MLKEIPDTHLGFASDSMMFVKLRVAVWTEEL